MIEVLVAILILAISAMTVFGLLSAAAKNTQRAKATQVALDKAQGEIEALRSLTNKELALTSAPPHFESPLNPGYRVNTAAGTFALTREPRGSYEKIVKNEGSLYGGGEIKGGVVNPGPTPFTSGDVKGEIYRYIVWRNDESCSEEDCPGTQDFKQVVVAVKLNTAKNETGERGYVEVQSDFIDPTDSPAGDPVPGAEGVVTAQQFYLTDTPCTSLGLTSRVEITESHPLHNTLGTCAQGLQTGATEGAPDALLLGAVPDTSPEDPTKPLIYDYASDYVYNEAYPGSDAGIQLLRDKTTGCNFEPTAETSRAARTHRWVSDIMSENFVMTGNVTIEIYGRALTEKGYKGTICVFLFKRHEEEGKAKDEVLLDKATGAPYWKFTPQGNANWVGTKWTVAKMTMPLSKVPFTIPEGDRLGVAVSLELGNSPADLSVLYDHPTYASRIEVETNTPIDGG